VQDRPLCIRAGTVLGLTGVLGGILGCGTLG
jgi:hypothetical protein